MRESAGIKTPFYTFDDNSTIKPNQNTIIRNPTLMRLGLGQHDPHQRNPKTQNIQPLNLSQKEFEVRKSLAMNNEEDDDFYSVKDNDATIKPLNRIFTYQDKIDKLTKQDVTKMCQMASQIIEEIADINSNLHINDISLVNSKGKSYEYAPFQYLMTNQVKIPNIIVKEINDAKLQQNSFLDFGFLDSLQTAYFCINKRLYLWPFSFGIGQDGLYTRQIIQNGLERMEFDQIITAAAACNPMPSMKLKDQDDKILVISTASEIKIKILRKGIKEGKLSIEETDYSIPTDSNVITKIVQFKRNGRIFYGGYDGHVNELILNQSKLDSLLSYFQGERKKLKKTDLEKGNILTRFIPQFLKFENKKRIIDIKIDEQRNVLYSIGSSVEERTLDQTIIEVFDLGILGNQFKKITSINQYEIVQKVFEFQNKSNALRGHDIYQISQNYKIVFMQPILFNESQHHHLLLATQNGMRVYIQFNQSSKDIPEEDTMDKEGMVSDFLFLERFTGTWELAQILDFPAEELVEEQLEQSISQGIFKVYNMQCSTQNLVLDMQSVQYDNSDSVMIFSDNVTGLQEFNPDDQNFKYLRINFIKKNESTYAHLKQLQTGQPFNMYEQYSHIQVVLDQPKINPYIQQFNPLDDYNPQLFGNEAILEIKTVTSYQNKELKSLLGINKSYQEYKGPFASSIYQYLPLSELEKQVYLLQKRVHVLTDQRVFEIQQVRPIDALAMILHTLTRPGNYSYEDFEDFMDLFSVREACSMLVQILADTNGSYLFSRRIENQIAQIKSKNKRQAQSQPRQYYRSGTVGSKSSLYHSPYGIGPRQSTYSSMMHDQRSTLDLVRFSGSDCQKEYILKNANHEIRQLSMRFLQVYGDTIPSDQLLRIEDEQLEGLPISSSQFSSIILLNNPLDKHYALYLYLQRLIRPVWDLRIVHPVNQGKVDIFIPTFESLKVVQQKLEGLFDLINLNKDSFFGESKKQFDPRFDQEIQIQKEIIFDQVKLVSELSYDDRERLEIMERNSLNNLKILITRCIEVINLLDILNFNNDIQIFMKLWKKLQKEQQLQLSHLRFQDLVNTQNNSLIRKVLEASIQIQQPGSSEQATQLIKERAVKIDRLCRNLFTKEENKAFIGESLLQTAIQEKNLQRREEILKQAIEQLSQEPIKIDLKVITPLLVDNGNFSSLVDLTLRKIKAINSLSEQQRQSIGEQELDTQLEECYSVVISLFAALDISINKTNNSLSSFGKNNKDTIDIESFVRKLNQIHNVELKINLLNRIMNRIEQFDDQLLLTTIFNYLITKPQNKFNIDLLPHISKESFDKICDQTIVNKAIQREQFESIVKILSKQQDAERLCILILNVCQDKQKLFTVDEESEDHKMKDYYVKMEDRLQYLQRAEIVLNNSQKTVNVDLQTKLANQINQCHKQVSLQAIILKNIQEYIEGQDNQINLKKNQDQDVTQLDQNKKNLQTSFNELNAKLFSKQELMKEFIEPLQLHESKLTILMQEEDQIYKHQDQILKAIENLIRDIFIMFPNKFQIKLKEKLIPFITDHSSKKDLLIQMLKLIEKQNELHYKDRKDFLQDLEQLHNGNRLIDTRFWLLEYCFDSEKIPFNPSEIINLFAQPTKRKDFNWQKQQQLEIQNEFVAARLLCLFKLWTDLNKKLFQNMTIQVQSQYSLNQTLTSQEKFIQDFQSNGVMLYQNIFKDKILEYVDKNKIVMEKNISILIEKISNQVDRELQAMLKQHSVKQPEPIRNIMRPFSIVNSSQDRASASFASQEEVKQQQERQVLRSPLQIEQNQHMPSPFNASGVSAISPNIQNQYDQFSIGNTIISQKKQKRLVQRESPSFI